VCLGQPEPGIEGREQVDERERVRRDDDEREEPEREERDRMAGERLLDRRGAVRDQALSPHRAQ
jgi:hypothetical protein